MLRFFLILIFMLQTFSVYAAFSNAEEFYLPNGLQVVVVPNHKAPIIQHTVIYKVGSIDEPDGKGGIAHLLEHLMFRGTHKFKDGQFDKLIEFNGGKSNAATSQNYTFYYQLLNIKTLELAMYLETDRMYGLKIDDKNFEKERDVVFQERQQRMNSDTTSEFWEQYNKFFWQYCPYGDSIAGTEHEIKNISVSDIKSFYDNFYAPNNTIVILSGDIDIVTARLLTEKYYGNIKSSSIGKKFDSDRCKMPDSANKSVTLHQVRSDTSVSRIVAQYMLPRFSGDDVRLYALILASSYLGDGVNSLLYENIINRGNLASSVTTDFYYLSRGQSIFSFSSYFNNHRNLSAVKKQYYRTVKQASKSLTVRRLAELKEKILSGIIYSQDNPSDAVRVITQWLGSGYTLDDLKNFENNIIKVTLKDVQSALNLITDSNHVWGEILPQGGKYEN